ncbi:hypothetical protein ACXPWS_14775 [Mycobacterium sp. BMJ-28]
MSILRATGAPAAAQVHSAAVDATQLTDNLLPADFDRTKVS